MKKRDTQKYINMFKLSKHEKKVNRLKEEILEDYYFNLRKRKEKKKPKARSWKEQNYISNAKMMLMQRNHLSEDEAYRYIQKSSMDSGTNMVETAQMLLMLLYDE